MTSRALALIAEVVDVLGAHRHLRCVPHVTDADGQVMLTVTFEADGPDEGLEVLSVRDELRYVCDVAQMRGLAERYGIAPAALERFLAHSQNAEAKTDT